MNSFTVAQLALPMFIGSTKIEALSFYSKAISTKLFLFDFDILNFFIKLEKSTLN